MTYTHLTQAERYQIEILCRATQPDKIIVHNVPDHCQVCHCELAFAYVAETRQVFDLPVMKYEVTEHHAMQAICRCGQVHTGEFPPDVRATVQYGPRAQATMVHLNQNHAVSIQRTAALMNDFFDWPVSQAAVVKATQAGADSLQPTVQDIGQAVVRSAVAHADETGLRVAKKLHWLHVLATSTLTWMGCHPKRGGEAFESLALLQHFKGVLVHDGWLPAVADLAPNFDEHRPARLVGMPVGFAAQPTLQRLLDGLEQGGYGLQATGQGAR